MSGSEPGFKINTLFRNLQSQTLAITFAKIKKKYFSIASLETGSGSYYIRQKPEWAWAQ
jgi:hypothetical protein